VQQLPVRENLYVLPPFVLIGPLLRFFIDQHYQLSFTIIVSDIQPRRYWWALLQATSIDWFTYHLHTVLFSRFHAPGKRPGGVHLVFIQMIMMQIFARLVVHQQEHLLPRLSSLVWTCRRSIAVLWPLNLCQVASLIRSRSLPWSNSCQVSSPFFHRQSPCPPLPPRISLNYLLVRIRQAELWFMLKHVTGKFVNAPPFSGRFRRLPYREVACHL